MNHRRKLRGERRSWRITALMACCLAIAISGCGKLQDQDSAEKPQPQSQYAENNAPHVPRATGPQRPQSHQAELNPDETTKQDGAPADSAPKHRPNPAKIEVKGIYVSGPVAGSADRMRKLIALAEQTEINAMVIDVKNDFGVITYDSHVPLADRIGADRNKYIDDIRVLLNELKQRRIYTIGRIVAFKDPLLASAHTELAIKRKSGSVWKDRNGTVWLDPYDDRAQRYVIEVAKEAAEIGFDEIQFDYVRFPDNGEKMGREVQYRNPANRSKAGAIEHFLREAYQQLSPLGVYVSADVFGLTTTATHDLGIGQMWDLLADEVDVLSPMIYPSHYASGNYGIRHPDLQPKEVVRRALLDALSKNEALASQRKADIRPWLQAFSATWLKTHQKYGEQQLRAQIKAAEEVGIRQYLLWNPKCEYPEFSSR